MAKKKNDKTEKTEKGNGTPPKTLSGQNLGHNSKKEGLGNNTNR